MTLKRTTDANLDAMGAAADAIGFLVDNRHAEAVAALSFAIGRAARVAGMTEDDVLRVVGAAMKREYLPNVIQPDRMLP